MANNFFKKPMFPQNPFINPIGGNPNIPPNMGLINPMPQTTLNAPPPLAPQPAHLLANKPKMNIGITQTTTTSPLSPPVPPLDASRLLAPKTEKREAYAELLGKAPQRGDYSPTKMGRIIAGLAGLSEGWKGGAAKGLEVSTGMIERPFRQAMEDYGTQAELAKQLAELERSGEEDIFKRHMDVGRYNIDLKKLGLDELSTMSSIALNDAEIADMEDIKSLRGLQTIEGSDGKIYVVDPRVPGKRTELGKFYESEVEKRTAEMQMYRDKFRIDQGGRLEILRKEMDHDAAMQKERYRLEGNLQERRHQLGQLDMELAHQLNFLTPEGQEYTWNLAEDRFKRDYANQPDILNDPREANRKIADRVRRILSVGTKGKGPKEFHQDPNRMIALGFLKENNIEENEDNVEDIIEILELAIENGTTIDEEFQKRVAAMERDESDDRSVTRGRQPRNLLTQPNLIPNLIPGNLTEPIPFGNFSPQNKMPRITLPGPRNPRGNQ